MANVTSATTNYTLAATATTTVAHRRAIPCNTSASPRNDHPNRHPHAQRSDELRQRRADHHRQHPHHRRNKELVIATNGQGITIASVIGTGAAAVTISGPGTVTIATTGNAANTFTGTLTVNNGCNRASE